MGYGFWWFGRCSYVPWTFLNPCCSILVLLYIPIGFKFFFGGNFVCIEDDFGYVSIQWFSLSLPAPGMIKFKLRNKSLDPFFFEKLYCPRVWFFEFYDLRWTFLTYDQDFIFFQFILMKGIEKCIILFKFCEKTLKTRK